MTANLHILINLISLRTIHITDFVLIQDQSSLLSVNLLRSLPEFPLPPVLPPLQFLRTCNDQAAAGSEFIRIYITEFTYLHCLLSERKLLHIYCQSNTCTLCHLPQRCKYTALRRISCMVQTAGLHGGSGLR